MKTQNNSKFTVLAIIVVMLTFIKLIVSFFSNNIEFTTADTFLGIMAFLCVIFNLGVAKN